MKTAGRNDPCPCGSGRKYKHCCHAQDQARAGQARREASAVREALQQAVQFQRAGRLPEAEARYQQVLQINPDLSKADLAGAHYNLGNVLRGQDRPEEAVASYRRALEIQPRSVEISGNLGGALKDAGRLEEAAAVYQSAIALAPRDALLHYNLGIVRNEQGRPLDALASYASALALDPRSPDIHQNLGSLLLDLGRPGEALAAFRKALEIQPGSGDALSGVALALADLGESDEALAGFRAALAARPSSATAYSHLLGFASYRALLSPEETLALARGWEQAVVPEAERRAARARVFRAAPLTGRRLKLGYVSGDFRQHAVSYFVEQIFRHHDAARVELFAYSTCAKSDAVTARLRPLAHHWRDAAGMSDAAIRDGIAADGIDVLVDLSGHTLHNRLGVFARRAAPVQVQYIGGLGSSGLTEMDYWLGDAIVMPPETDAQFSEQVWRLPRVWLSYDGRADAPRPAPRAEADGAVRLGSFANLSKLTPRTLALWAKLLQALPEGRLLLKTKGLADPGVRERILGILAANGAASERVELQDWRTTPDWAAHMGSYHRLDVALDPVDVHTGATTTCDALWMGVPVITKMGERMGFRMTATTLDALGHPEWIARSDDEYAEKAVALARDAARRAQLRVTLRDEMAASPLCDARDLARNLEDAYIGMYERWLGGETGRNS